jgi:hypothetical protein
VAAAAQEGLFDEEALEPGDSVLVHFPGEVECWRGPFVVMKRINACSFRVRSDQYGEMVVDTARLQELSKQQQQQRQKQQQQQQAGKGHFVLNVGRSTAKDVVVALAKEAGSERDPYKSSASHEFVDRESDDAIRRARRSGGSGGGGSGMLEPQQAEKEADEKRRQLLQTKRKATVV